MPVCIFQNCDSGSKEKGVNRNKNLYLHRFPKDLSLRLVWLQKIKYGQSIDENLINLETGNSSSFKFKINPTTVIHVSIIQM